MPVTAAAREAILLPLLFLTVGLLGGLRIADTVTWLPPPLFTLVLALLMVGALVRCRTFAPECIMNPSRSTLANLNGLVVLLTVLVASAQAFNLATPDTGLPRTLFVVLFLILLLNTLVASADRSRMLWSLLVIFGSAFLLKFVVLAELSSPVEGLIHRALLALFEGVTLGMVSQPPLHSATGYLALLTLALFVIGLTLLPSGGSGNTEQVSTTN